MKRYQKNILRSSLLGQFAMLIRLNSFKRKWIRHNKHNQTVPTNFFDEAAVSVGDYTYGELTVISYNNTSRLTIGRCVSIAEKVSFLLDVEHHIDHFSTYPFKVKMLEMEKKESFSKGDIIVEDDVWIGYGATVLSGVSIGKGSIVAAGALVTKSVPPYSIVAGIPAKVIRYRFDQSIIRQLSDINYIYIGKEFVAKNLDCLYQKVDNSTISEIVNRLTDCNK